MVKLLVAALILVLVSLGFYFFRSNQAQNLPGPLNPPTQIISNITPATPEDDVTALDRNLSELESSEESFSQELNNL